LRLFYESLPILRKAPYDVYHFQFGPAALNWLPLFDSGLLAGRIAVSFRGYDVSRFVREHGEGAYAPLFARADLCLPNCEYFRRRLLRLGARPSTVVVHRSGIDLARFAWSARGRPADGRVRVVSVGRLVEKKGIAYAIQAMARVARVHPDASYTVIGDGPLRGDLEQAARDCGLGSRVAFLGARPHQEIARMLDDCHILVAPSVTAGDGNEDAPVNALKEAMAMGLPVVGTRHGGIPELVEDGVSGVLVPERDPDELARALLDLMARADQWPQMGRAGRAAVERSYDLERLNDELESLFLELVV
jgi:colanic acid/amylovoran biosynthesis glycosyltransferase